MINFDYNGKVYKGRDQWSEITLADYLSLVRLAIPDKLRAYYISLGKLNEENPESVAAFEASLADITEREWVKEFPLFYGKVIALLSDIPVESLHYTTRSEIYDRFFRHFIMTACYDIPMMQADGKLIEYMGEEMSSFEFEGETYYFPPSLRLLGEVVPMYDEEAVTFCEAADIELSMRSLADEGVEKFALVAAIYCRKKGEKYDEAVALERGERFKNLPMNVIWSLFFYIEKLTLSFTKDMIASLKEAKKQLDAAMASGD